jgi:fluoroacetyl-CoA thioesterase
MVETRRMRDLIVGAVRAGRHRGGRKGADMPLAAGLRGRAETEVTANQTAESLGSGNLPVYGTPALVALMEAAAVNALAGHLEPSETTVGTAIHVTHLAATPVGLAVRAEAELTEVDGRKLTFVIQAYDPRERIGEAQHQRVVVSRDRFLSKVTQKR